MLITCSNKLTTYCNLYMYVPNISIEKSVVLIFRNKWVQLKIKTILCKKEIWYHINIAKTSTISSFTTVDHTTFSCNIIECFGAKRLHFPVQNLMSFCDFSGKECTIFINSDKQRKTSNICFFKGMCGKAKA